MTPTSQQPWILRFGRGYACMLGDVRVCQFMPDRWTSEEEALRFVRMKKTIHADRENPKA